MALVLSETGKMGQQRRRSILIGHARRSTPSNSKLHRPSYARIESGSCNSHFLDASAFYAKVFLATTLLWRAQNKDCSDQCVFGQNQQPINE